ncbi:tetratricopeptide (TPR) repeat protein [Actinoalloteichus hymeniacidonis]|uniref:NB-ARC domain-containing protein n=1 Tax=Actinoalloteichus hymeniacidonis TaxID=340345 RepID=UPI00161DCCE2|nr:NB-ARC domain-containing protein [Actinoalloteichus hymeniacidonis]MBB5907660.1 tetratricopeptide (TPR) repeat protein [Actinoalloteichus hymeniacidonis]
MNGARSAMDGAHPDRSGTDPAVGNSADNVGGSVIQVGTVHGGVTVALPAQQIPVPQQIPLGGLGRFVNRVAELSAVDEVLGDAGADSAWIVVLTGLAGVGKSALARRWSRDARDRFPGGQLYIDYSTRRTEAGTAVSDAVGECLRALGVHPEHIPPGLAERTALYRTKTANRPVLVLLDDVTEVAHVEPLVPNSPGSAVVVTCTERLSEAAFETDARVVVLDPLDGAGGVQLLSQLCGASRVAEEPAAAEQLVRLCGGLPIALRVVAARLVARPQLNLADLVTELSDERSRLRALSARGERTVSTVFEHSYRGLSTEAALMYRRLALLPGPDCTLDTATLAADVDEQTARAALAALLDANLLTEQPDERYRLHDLLRLHAAERAAQEEPERANLLALLRASAEIGWDERAWQLAEAIVPLYLNRRNLEDWIESSEIGADAARRVGHPAAEARLRSLVSRAYTDLGEHERAGTELSKALELAESAGGRRLLASVWEFLGRHRDIVDPSGAIEAYRRSIELNVAVGEPRGAALGRYFLGRTLQATNRPGEALGELYAARDSLAALGDRRMTARVLVALGLLHTAIGDDELAEAELTEAADTFVERGAVHYEAAARRALADLAEQRQDRAGAHRQLTRLLAIEIETGGPEVAVVQARLARLTD